VRSVGGNNPIRPILCCKFSTLTKVSRVTLQLSSHFLQTYAYDVATYRDPIDHKSPVAERLKYQELRNAPRRPRTFDFLQKLAMFRGGLLVSQCCSVRMVLLPAAAAATAERWMRAVRRRYFSKCSPRQLYVFTAQRFAVTYSRIELHDSLPCLRIE